MSILSWNSQGLGRPQDLTVQRLMEMRKKHFPEILFLMETMNIRNVLVDIQVWLGYDRVFTVDPVGRCGGLALLWKKGVEVNFLSVDKNLLDLRVNMGASSFFVSCVYGNPNSSLRYQVWEKLIRIGILRKDCWCMVGDFNEILHNGEKLGGPRKSEASFVDFGNMLSACGMVELSSTGNGFTWSGRRMDLWIQCKLDRCFGNKDWFKTFPASNQAFLEKKGSDHRPVLVSLVSSQDTYRGSFRFDKRMLHKPLVKEAIVTAWMASSTFFGQTIFQRLRRCRKALSNWKRENVTNAQTKINSIQQEIELEHAAIFPSFARMAILKRDMVLAHREEESFWSQKSRQKWMHSGDKNTKYFHASVKAERNKNGLEKLVDDDGTSHCSEASKGDVAARYFQKLFSSSYPATNDLLFFQDFVPRVSIEMNNSLCAEVTNEEVKAAVFSIKPSSAPGSDGMTGFFFQQYWDIVGDQVIAEVLRFFKHGEFQSEWNLTQLCLIPKKVNASKMVDLRPISLCSVMYKIISKILVSRLKPLLTDIVSPNQSAFVEERLISDNILIAHEIVHGLRTHNAISKDFLAIKTDMSKAFDRVEWSYLKALLSALGFRDSWVDLIMTCVTTVSYTILINGQAFGLVKPRRGLRQGDPISPFLFVLCTEGLTHLLNKAELDGRINGVQFSQQGPSIHHLLFADDTLFVCKAEVSQCETIQEILNIYGKATGQIINKDKSSITFGAKVAVADKEIIQSLLMITNEGGAGTYLGLPECFSGSKKDMLEYINDRLKNKLSGWFARTLSQGGKEILIKSVAMAMPVYAMSCFKLPKATCTALSSAISSFWWSTMENKKKIHWVAWDKMCLPKDLGGFGFKDIEVFNQALLAKQAWRLLHNPSCLFSLFFKSRYFSEIPFLQAATGSRPSFAWKSILHGRSLLEKGLRLCIGDGESTSVWSGQWLFDGRMRAPLMKNIFVDLDLKVFQLIDPHSKTWDPDILQDLFFQNDIDIISAIMPVVSGSDFWCWLHNKSGDYSVRSGYWLGSKDHNNDIFRNASALPSINPIKDLIWNTLAPSKIKIFMWKAISGAIPVADKLASRGIHTDQRCQLCGHEGETINHILFVCTLARQIWALSDIPSPENGFGGHSLLHNFHFILILSKSPSILREKRRSIPWILWILWKNRNHIVFEGLAFLVQDMVGKIQEDASQWFLAQQVEEDERVLISLSSQISKPFWRPPEKPWLKCNLASSWDSVKKQGGAAWVLRNSHGSVLLHSRTSFANMASKNEAELHCWLWSIESMSSLKVRNVCFAVESKDLMQAVLRPAAWPSFKFQSEILRRALQPISNWKLCSEDRKANKGANLIAKSVTNEDRRQSYVASGYPFWLKDLFTEEMCVT